MEKKLYLKLISRNKRSGDWLSNLIGRNKRSSDWLRENCNFDLLLAAARARSTYFAKKLKKVGMTHENKKSCKQYLIESIRRELPKIAQ